MVPGQLSEDRSVLIQGALAGLVLAGVFAVVIVELIQGKTVAIPDVLSIMAATVVGVVFGQRGVASGFHAATNGITALAQSQNPPAPPAGTVTTTTQGGGEVVAPAPFPSPAPPVAAPPRAPWAPPPA